MSPLNTPLSNPAPRWSERLAQRYALQLDASLVDWLDAQAWQQTGNFEFNQPIAPEQLLTDAPDAIWPGLMPPDFLPVLGNKYGDWLCLRVGPDNQVTEIVHWYHGGGDWIPWGRSLPEAIFFDAVRQHLPGRRQHHAIAAEPRRQGDTSDRLLVWALQHLPPIASQCVQSIATAQTISTNLARDLINTPICEIAVRCELVLAALDNSFRSLMSPALAAQLEVSWEPQVVRWLFDCDQLQPTERTAIQKLATDPVDFSQDWLTAAEHCRTVANAHPDLGWACDIAGWAAEREGDVKAALQWYQRGSLATAFADQSIRFRSHWFPQAAGKFSTWRLLQLTSPPSDAGALRGDAGAPPTYTGALPSPDARQASTPQWLAPYLDVVQQSDAHNLRPRVFNFWLEQAHHTLASGNPHDAYQAFYRAGWDLGIEKLSSYRELLQHLTSAAQACNQQARAALAQTHLQVFLQRFG